MMSPALKARFAGFFYLCNVGAPLALFKSESLLQFGDAAATARNILLEEPTFRLAIAAGVLAYAAYIVVAVLLYCLLRPVSRTLSLLAASFCVTGSIIGTIVSLFQLASLVLLGGQAGSGIEVAAMTSLKMYAQGFELSMVFFGLYMLLVGALVAGSRFMPRIIGILTMATGAAYLAHSLLFIAAPPIAASLTAYVYLFGVGELTLVLWLLIAGVDDRKWREQAALALAGDLATEGK